MSHDKIKSAARRRMAQTGDSYTTARREVIKAYKAVHRDISTSDTSGFEAAEPDMGALSAAMRQAADLTEGGILIEGEPES